MNTSKLLFRGYASHDLDEISTVFLSKFGKVPDAFVIRPDYVVSGERSNHEKVITSRLCSCNCVMVPLHLSKTDIEEIYSNLSDYHAIERVDTETVDPELTRVWDDERVRYCIHCGQAFEAELISQKLICDKPECAEKEREHKEAVAAVKQTYAKPEPKIEEPKEKTIKPVLSDDFELIDPLSNVVSGYVYLIEADNGLSKIGRSDDVWRRFNDLMMMNAANITLRHAIHTINSARSEFYLHKQFNKYHSHGEWFNLPKDDILWFSGLKDGALDHA